MGDRHTLYRTALQDRLGDVCPRATRGIYGDMEQLRAECRNRGPGREAMTFPGQPRRPPGTLGDSRAPLRSLPKLSPAALPAGGPALAGRKGGKYPLVSLSCHRRAGRCLFLKLTAELILHHK